LIQMGHYYQKKALIQAPFTGFNELKRSNLELGGSNQEP